MKLANQDQLRPYLCRFCGKPIVEKKKLIDGQGQSHIPCWQEWARNDPEYQTLLAIYKATPHPNYYVLDPDDADRPIAPATETVIILS
jgi:hypothetical protein